MRSDLNAIPVFVAVVECGNFAQAAEKLNVTRSAVGKTISRLEQRLWRRAVSAHHSPAGIDRRRRGLFICNPAGRWITCGMRKMKFSVEKNHGARAAAN